MRAIITKPTALVETRLASAMIATTPIQSPMLEITCAPNNCGNPGARNTSHGFGGIGSASGDGGMNGAGGCCCGSVTR
jgi:hypothetical protein